jgi:hypothetical protein
MLNKFLGTLTLVFLLSSCANYKIHYSPEEQNWVKNIDPPQTEPTHVIYLIGDAGNSSEGEVAPALNLLRTKLESAPAESSVIYLGDNIYPHGLPPNRSSGKSTSRTPPECSNGYSGKL